MTLDDEKEFSRLKVWIVVKSKPRMRTTNAYLKNLFLIICRIFGQSGG
jgi:hypothetical protein